MENSNLSNELRFRFGSFFDLFNKEWKRIQGKLTEDMSTNTHRGLIPEVNIFLHRKVVLCVTLVVFVASWVFTGSLSLALAIPTGLWIIRSAWCVKLVRKNNYHLIESMQGFKRIVVNKEWYWKNEWDSVADRGNMKLRKVSLKSKDIDLSNYSGPFNVFEMLQIGKDGMSPEELRQVLYDRYYNWDSVEERENTVQDAVDSFLRRVYEKASSLQNIQQAKVSDYYYFETVSDEDRSKHEDTLKKAGLYHPSAGKKILFTGPDLTQQYKDATANRYTKQENAKAEREAAVLKAEGDKRASILKAQGEKKAIELVSQGRVLAIKEYTKRENLGMSVGEAVAQRNVETKRDVLKNAKNITIFDDDADAKRERPKMVIPVGAGLDSSSEKNEEENPSSQEGEK